MDCRQIERLLPTPYEGENAAYESVAEAWDAVVVSAGRWISAEGIAYDSAALQTRSNIEAVVVVSRFLSPLRYVFAIYLLIAAHSIAVLELTER